MVSGFISSKWHYVYSFLMIVVVVMLMLVASANVKADSIFDEDEWYLDSTITSVHFSSKDYNTKNSGFGITWQPSKTYEIRAGYYKNSYYKQSEYFIVNLFPHPRSVGNWDINPAFGLGAVTGYKGTDGDVGATLGSAQLGLVPNVSFTYRPLGLRATVLLAGNAVALQGSFKFRSF